MFNDEELHSLKERQFAKCFLTDDSPCFDNWCSLEIDHNVPPFLYHHNPAAGRIWIHYLQQKCYFCVYYLHGSI